MLDALQNPIVIAVVVLVLVVLIAIPVLVRRRRAAQGEVLPPPELGQPVDYTSVPYVEPKTLGERFRDAPIGVKLLLILVPLALIIAGFVVWQAFFSAPEVANVPPPPPPSITDVTATLASAARIVVDAKTNLPDGTVVTAAMKEGGSDFAWANQQSAQAQVSGGLVRVVIERDAAAPRPRRDQEHTLILSASANNQSVSSEAAKLTIPSIYVNDFFRDQAAPPTVAPTAAPAPTA
ncbi:MAG TPA: SH3 domain-containing protein, partial [Kouleothrix sp.]|nr:SH3 domain-containing protein [Kouleothrix sp.]